MLGMGEAVVATNTVVSFEPSRWSASLPNPWLVYPMVQGIVWCGITWMVYKIG